MTPDTLLDRILWTQLARVVHGSPPEWEPEAASARALRAVLAETELDPEESGIVERWDAGREGSRMLFDRLLQTRVNRAVRAGSGSPASHHDAFSGRSTSPLRHAA